VVISNRPGELRAGSSGKVIPGYEAMLFDEEGHDVAPGEIGSLLIKGDSICAGYWNRHERTKAAFEGAWFRTGDKYYQDDDGYYCYAGRADDLFKVNGRWLNPAEVESALIAHPAVQEAAVIAREDANHLTKPAAYVVARQGFAASDELARSLQDWVIERSGPTSISGGCRFSRNSRRPPPASCGVTNCGKCRHGAASHESADGRVTLTVLERSDSMISVAAT
jgi:acyl-coenzyme A synthetase/AMP-(fatty) acid ligase